MRILHLIKHCNLSNGHVNVAVDLACVHARQGHAVTVGSGGGDYVGFLREHGVRHAAVKLGRLPVGPLIGLAALLRLCREFRPHVIHAHMMSSAVLGFLASRLLGVPLVTTMHNSFDRHSGLMRLGRVVVAVSEAERRLLVSRGYPERKVVAVRNGTVGSPRATMREAGALPVCPHPCVVTVCGLHPRKGVNHLIAAFAQVAADHPAWQLAIVGYGPDRDALEAQAAVLGLAERIHFLGSLRNPAPLLRQAKIFALASLADPSSLVLTEARAAGCAVVATDVGGSAEALAFGAAGQLVPAGDPVAMAQAFRALMSDPETLRLWRRRAATDLEAFGVEQTAAKYLAVYRAAMRPVAPLSEPRSVTPPIS